MVKFTNEYNQLAPRHNCDEDELYKIALLNQLWLWQQQTKPTKPLLMKVIIVTSPTMISLLEESTTDWPNVEFLAMNGKLMTRLIWQCLVDKSFVELW